jgi:hypothetical protein
VRFKLQAKTDKLISAETFVSPFVLKCVAPMRCLSGRRHARRRGRGRAWRRVSRQGASAWLRAPQGKTLRIYFNTAACQACAGAGAVRVGAEPQLFQILATVGEALALLGLSEGLLAHPCCPRTGVPDAPPCGDPSGQ